MMRNLFLVFTLLFSLISQAAIPTRLGDTEVLGYLKPGSAGIDLGSSVAQWDAYLQNIHLYNQDAGALYLDSGNSVASLSSVSLTELGYLDGVTSPIQTQLEAKLGASLSTGYVYVGDGSSIASAAKITDNEVAAGANIQDTKLATIATPGKVANAATSATAANTASTIMLRDAVGQVAASTFTGNLVGNVTGTASGNPPSARTILTTAPMYGGGDLSANRTFAMYQASGSSDGYLGSSDYVTLMAKVAATRAINTTAPLSGGGDLSADRTLSIADGSSTASGVVNTSAQEFAGQKDFQKIGIKQTTDSSTGNIDALTTTSFSSFRLTGAAPVLRGISGGSAGRIIVIVNASGTTISVKNEDATPSAANKIITGTAADLTLADTASVVLQYDGTSSRWRVVGGSGGGSSAAGNAAITSVTQSSHGFSVGNLIYNTGSAYAKAIATSEAAAEVLGIVTTVPTANTFTFTTVGELSGILTGLTPGAAYFLSDSVDGGYTATEPSTVGYVSKPVFVAAGSSTAAFVIQSRGQVITAAVGSVATSRVKLYGDNNYGSTNTKVNNFTTIETVGTDLTGTNSGTLGGKIVVNVSGTYSCSVSFRSLSGGFYGMSYETGSWSGTTDIYTLLPANGWLCAGSAPSAGLMATCSITREFPAASIIHAHGDASSVHGTNPTTANLTCTRVN